MPKTLDKDLPKGLVMIGNSVYVNTPLHHFKRCSKRRRKAYRLLL